MNEVLYPVLFVTGGGAALGLILGLVAKFMYVPVDELTEEIRAALPGANCGACGYVGCMEYAEHLSDKTEKAVNLCTPGGATVADALGKILGVQAGWVVPKNAVVRCGGTCDKTGYSMDYEGPKTCAACATYFSGRGACSYGCIGFGDCVSVCIYDAIYMENGVPVVDKARCTGCSMCASVCPHKLIDLKPTANEVHVICSSKDKGGVTRKYCSAGCIGCMKCEKTCEFDAIHVKNNLAEIDTDKCTNCQKCLEVCPVKCIVFYEDTHKKS